MSLSVASSSLPSSPPSEPDAPLCELTILLPCLNEEHTVVACIHAAHMFLRAEGVDGEVLVVDNGSSDASVQDSREAGARVVIESKRGYGNVLRSGIALARGTYVILGDSDLSYDFKSIMPFLDRLRSGADLVVGNRFLGGIDKNAMPFLHRYVGNPILSFVGALFFRGSIGDFHCGLRGCKKSAMMQIHLASEGMEFASEMVVKSLLYGLSVSEVPTHLYRDGRGTASHLKTWRDGWRHLRFLLLYSPRWLFFYPGLLLMVLGVAGVLFLLPMQRSIFDVHTLLYCATALNAGLTMVLFALLAKFYAVQIMLMPHTRLTRLLTYPLTLEIGLIVGVGCLVLGLALTAIAGMFWYQEHFGSLDPRWMLRIVIPAVTLLSFGLQLMYGSFFLSVLKLHQR